MHDENVGVVVEDKWHVALNPSVLLITLPRNEPATTQVWEPHSELTNSHPTPPHAPVGGL